VRLGGDDAYDLCRRIGLAARELRDGTLAGGRDAFAAQIRTLTDDELEDLSRAFGLQCHLMNIAETRARLAALGARGENAADGLVAAIDRLVGRGATADEIHALFDRALVMPVLTAHPTEARRRSTLDHVTLIERLLDELDATGRTRVARAVDAEVLTF